MKNIDEFRRTVMEKADRYKAQKRVRNKKIRETALLFSICIAIALSIYTGFYFGSMFQTSASGSHESYSDHTECGIPTECQTTDTELTDAQTTPHGTTTSITKTTMGTSRIETTEESSTAPEAIGIEHPDFSFAVSSRESDNINESFIIRSMEELNRCLAEFQKNHQFSSVFQESVNSYYTEDYFADSELIVVLFSSDHPLHFITSYQEKQETLTLSFHAAKSEEALPDPKLYYFFFSTDKSTVSTVEITLSD